MANILIVEDNDSLKLAYSSFLTQEGHQVATASSVDEALAYLKEHTPDLLLVDMLMPGKNGLELLQNYDLRNEHKNVKAIAFSNLSEERIQEEALSLGANLYLTKSLTGPKELVDTIAGVLAAA
jgi:two-component system response regulator AtoC